eukprot:Sdes_comp17129_c0_seq2m6290
MSPPSTFNTASVLCEAILLMTLLHSLSSVAKIKDEFQYFYWTVAYTIMSVASLAGLFKFAGFEAVSSLHNFLSRVGETLGVVSLVLGCLGKLAVLQTLPKTVDLYVFAFASIILSFATQPGRESFVKILHTPALLYLTYQAYCALHTVQQAPHLLCAIGILVVLDPIQTPLSRKLGLCPVDVFHLFFSLSIVFFTSFAIA